METDFPNFIKKSKLTLIKAKERYLKQKIVTAAFEKQYEKKYKL